MNKQVIIVPNGIRYISEWSDYSLEHYQFPHILNKTITGCGYTEYCITNPFNVILCSPRKILLENKEDQHPGEVYYVRNEVENQTNFEKDFSGNNGKNPKPVLTTNLGFSNMTEESVKTKILKLKDGIRDYYSSCQPSPFNSGRPCKILVTYDSFRHVKEALGERINDFYIVIDEFQSIFTDAKFKSNTELEFVEQIKDLQRVCFVSATPMMENYLEMLEYFKTLPYFELDWVKEDPGRVIKPQINVKYCGKRNTIQAEIKKVVEKYRSGVYEVYRYKDENGLLQEIQSKEAVIYVNSVLDITKAIKYNHLTIDQCNILVSKTTNNEDKIRRAFGGKKKDGIVYIGTIPKQGEKHKMFTFCTRTVYLGADFYSTCAKSYIFSNANIDCLSVDISLDLPQILGRQRLIENPWKNSADLYVTLKCDKNSKQEFIDYMNRKDKATNDLLNLYNKGTNDEKDSLVINYEKVAKTFNYKDDYVAVNHHSGSSIIPVFNKLMQVAELRTFEIQEYDYKDRFAVLSRINQEYNISERKDKIDSTLNRFNHEFTTFIDKMKYLCSQKENLSNEEYNTILSLVPMEYSNYIITLGVDKIKTWRYQRSDLDKEFKKLSNQQGLENDVIKSILSSFKIGERDTKANIKERLGNIYNSLGYTKTPKASDIEEWFEVKSCQISNKATGKRDMGFEIVKKKGD